ncbi:hypothetical protein BTVI_43030 [Pitangus sulphuratus]|nr:hypothetical protein BTVI_43030 [Pitangus sulphuratus]
MRLSKAPCSLLYADPMGNLSYKVPGAVRVVEVLKDSVALQTKMTYWVIGGDKCSRNGNLARNPNAPKSEMTKELKSDRQTHAHIISR